MMRIKKISYSSLTQYKDCPRYFYLRNILYLKDFTQTVSTIYGKLIHKYCQLVLQHPENKEEYIKKYNRTWMKFLKLYAKYVDKEKYDLVAVGISGNIILRNIYETFQKQFGNFEVVYVEKRLKQKLEKWGIIFKGFIDLVLKLENGSHVILDLKNCSSVYWFKKSQDKYKDYQLTLYKHFLCKELNLDLKTTETYFILLERNPKSKNIIECLRVTSGNKKIDNAFEFVDEVLEGVKREDFRKNDKNCYNYGKWCTFRNTKYCPLNK